MTATKDPDDRLRVADELVGERVRLRRFRAEDAEALAGYRSDPDTARFQAWQRPYPLDKAHEFVAELADDEPGLPGSTSSTPSNGSRSPV